MLPSLVSKLASVWAFWRVWYILSSIMLAASVSAIPIWEIRVASSTSCSVSYPKQFALFFVYYMFMSNYIVKLALALLHIYSRFKTWWLSSLCCSHCPCRPLIVVQLCSSFKCEQSIYFNLLYCFASLEFSVVKEEKRAVHHHLQLTIALWPVVAI